MTEELPEDHDPSERRGSYYIGLALLGVLAIALLSTPILAVVMDRAGKDEPRMMMGDMGGTPVELATLDPSLASLYRGAKSHGSHFDDIPCFCGCQEGRLEHRHLLDCFVLKDGRGWESHATGCEVCQGEARMALDLLRRGTPPAEVRNRIIDEYGTPREMRDLQEG